MITKSNISSMKMKNKIAQTKTEIIDRTMCQRSTSRWSIKLISDSFPDPDRSAFLNVLKIDRKKIFEGVKLLKKEIRWQLPNDRNNVKKTRINPSIKSMSYNNKIRNQHLQLECQPPTMYLCLQSFPAAIGLWQSYNGHQNKNRFHVCPCK